MPQLKNSFCANLLLLISLVACALRVDGQETPAAASNRSASPSPTPTIFSPQTLAELQRLQQAALSSDYAYRQVGHLANNIGPRLSGSAQAAKAVEYVANVLKAIGCEVLLEKVMVPHWVRGEETSALVQFPGHAPDTTQKIVLCALGPSVATPANGITAEVIAVRNFDELNSLPRDKVAGKIVLFNYPFDKQIAAEGRAGEAYGVAVSMEVANLIQKLRLKPKRTIRVIAWMNEENGEAGSKQYAKDHEKEFSNHFAAMETDAGAGHPIGVNVKTNAEVKKMFAPVAAILQESGAGILDLVEHCGADIEPLEKAGVPAFSPIQDNRFYFNYHHTAADTLDKIVTKELAEHSSVVAIVVYALQNMQQLVPR